MPGSVSNCIEKERARHSLRQNERDTEEKKRGARETVQQSDRDDSHGTNSFLINGGEDVKRTGKEHTSRIDEIVAEQNRSLSRGAKRRSKTLFQAGIRRKQAKRQRRTYRSLRMPREEPAKILAPHEKRQRVSVLQRKSSSIVKQVVVN